MAINGVNIKISNLTHQYSSKSPFTFKDVSIEAKAGELLVIIGRSGCGKSTLLQIAAGLLKTSEGEVHFNDELITKTSPRWVMMFQAPHLFPWMTVERNVGVGLHFSGWSKDKMKTRVDEAIELVGLQEYAQNNVQDLSGGQQQRVALARSLVMDPDLLLLDEPFSALDTFTRTALQKDVRAIAKKMGFNLMMVTHDIDEAVIMADRVLVMAGAPGEIKHDINIDLKDPRERESKGVKDARKKLMKVFQDSSSSPSSASSADN
jgi:NitT/TauT family transport system ATP-binding protein